AGPQPHPAGRVGREPGGPACDRRPAVRRAPGARRHVRAGALTATDAAAATRARAAELRRRLATFQPEEPAPDWLPAPLLQHIATLPAARRAWQRGVGRPAQRAQLIRAGAGGRRDYAAGSETARNLAALLRR